MPDDVAAFLLRHDRAFADAPALYDERRAAWLSHGQLRRAAAAWARHFSLSRRQLVFVSFANRLDSVLAYLASLSSGCAVAIIEWPAKPAAMQELIARYQPDWVHIPEAASLGSALPADYDAVAAPCRGGAGMWRRKIRGGGNLHPHLALLLPTSGTTGSPKFVRLTAANLIVNTEDIIDALGISPDERAITSLPLHYSFGLSVLHSHLRAGASVILTERTIGTPEFWSLARDQGCTSFAGVPFSYGLVRHMNFAQLAVPTLRKMIQAGGRLDPADARHFWHLMESRGGEFFIMYGQTEASPRMTTLGHNDLPRKEGSVGRALRRGRICVLRNGSGADGARACAAREIGEIYYHGPNVMLGYAQARSDLTRGDDMQGVLATGDLGYQDEEGYLYLCGRSNRIAKILGHRVNLDDVEAIGTSYGRCAAMEMNGRLIVFMARAGDRRWIKSEMLKLISIPPGSLIIRDVDSIPVGRSGKVDYSRLAASMPAS
jgi:long-chain acyl-CoA synthetase